MTPEQVAVHFTHQDGSYHFARWGRAIVPVIFGVDAASLPVLKGAIEVVVAMAGHKMGQLDPELGANLMIFFMADWQELAATPKLDLMIGDTAALVGRLEAANANQYRTCRFDETGAIKATFVFLRLDEALNNQPAEDLALSQVAQAMLVWSKQAFATLSPLMQAPGGGGALVRPEIAALIRAAYDPSMPVCSRDASHALRLAARMED